MTLGVLAIVLAGCAPVGVILGYLAWSKAQEDLAMIQAGAIRNDELSLIKAGQICGIVGMCLSGLVLLFWGFQLLVFLAFGLGS